MNLLTKRWRKAMYYLKLENKQEGFPLGKWDLPFL